MTTPFKLTMKRVLTRCRAAVESGRLQATAIYNDTDIGVENSGSRCYNYSTHKGKVVYCAIGSALPCKIRQKHNVTVITGFREDVLITDPAEEIDMSALQGAHDRAVRSKSAYNAFLTKLVELETKYNINIFKGE